MVPGAARRQPLRPAHLQQPAQVSQKHTKNWASLEIGVFFFKSFYFMFQNKLKIKKLSPCNLVVIFAATDNLY
jgi:hypothetical protein